MPTQAFYDTSTQDGRDNRARLNMCLFHSTLDERYMSNACPHGVRFPDSSRSSAHPACVALSASTCLNQVCLTLSGGLGHRRPGPGIYHHGRIGEEALRDLTSVCVLYPCQFTVLYLLTLRKP